MRTRLTSLVLLLIVAGGAFAGTPLHSSEQSCPMGGALGDMDCCKAALMKAQTAESASAQLCCALNCSKDGTSPSNSVRPSPQLQRSVSVYPVGAQQLLATVFSSHVDRLDGPYLYSNPAYIRHLSLLI
jgi:hypothetical protein